MLQFYRFKHKQILKALGLYGKRKGKNNNSVICYVNKCIHLDNQNRKRNIYFEVEKLYLFDIKSNAKTEIQQGVSPIHTQSELKMPNLPG